MKRRTRTRTRTQKKRRQSSSKKSKSNSTYWKPAIGVAIKKYNKTHSLSKSRIAAKRQILSNIHHLFGANNERLYV